MKSLILSIDGMTCSACSNGLEKYLNKQNGIFNSSVNLVMANATITYDEKILNQEKIEKYIKQAGFKSLGVFKKINTKKNSKKEKIQFIIFTILAIILMYIAMGHMVGLPIINFLSPHNNPINYTMCLLILAIAFLIYGYDILKNGYKNLIHKIPNMDTLVAIGVISSFAYSLYGVFMIFKGNLHYVMNLYFESSAIIIYFVKLGRYIDKISKDKTKEALQQLMRITQNHETILRNGKEETNIIDPMVEKYNYTGIAIQTNGKNNTKIAAIYSKSPAEQQGLVSGDVILKVNDIDVLNDVTKLLEEINKTEGKEIKFTVERNNEIIDALITPEVQTNYYMGVYLKKAENNFANNIYYAYFETLNFGSSIIDNLKLLFTGNVSINQMVGPVGIGEIVAETNGFADFAYILAVVSISLGFTNLLPFPPLDGGKIVILLIEAIRRKPINEKVEIYIQMAGFVILIGLSILVTYNDVLRIFW